MNPGNPYLFWYPKATTKDFHLKYQLDEQQRPWSLSEIIQDCKEYKEESAWVQLFLPDNDDDDAIPFDSEDNQEDVAANDKDQNETFESKRSPLTTPPR